MTDMHAAPKLCPAHTSHAESFEALLSLDAGLIRCPYPLYAELRREKPVYWSEKLNSFVVSRYDDIMAVLTDPVTFSSAHQSGNSSVTALAQRLSADPATPPELRRQAGRRLAINAKPALINADPPLHVRQRKLVSQGFTPRRVGLMEPEVRRVATELLDRVAGNGAMDFVREYAQPLPMTVIANVLGVPPERQSDFKRWSNAFTQGVGALGLTQDQIAELFHAVDEFYDYFTEQIEFRRIEPRDDLLTDLVTARLDGEQPLTVNEMLQMLVVFLVGGNETTTNLLSWMTHRLLTDQVLMGNVRRDLGLLPDLAEEMLRLEAPVQGLFRTAMADVEIQGVSIPRGSMLWLVYASANHDDSVFSAPDDVDLRRTAARPHLAFGRGEHFCLGASIARLEARVGMELFISRFDDLRLAKAADPFVHPSFVLHGLSELPVTFTAH
jgi:cytochrome P450